MADDVQLPVTGDGTADIVVATDDRSGIHYQRVLPAGAKTNAAGQVEVTNSSTTIVSARVGRQRLIIMNYQTVPIYVDPSGGTAATTHFRVDPGGSLTLLVVSAVTARTTDAYTAASNDYKVHYIEEYD